MAEKLNLSDIIQIDFPENQYYKEETSKNQIIIHHTVSSGNAQNVASGWMQDPQHIATAFIIGGDSNIYQLFSSKYWAHALGIKSDFLKEKGFSDYSTRNVTLNKAAIQIEICNWGGLVQDTNEQFYPALWDTTLHKYVPNKKVKPIPPENVQTYDEPFRDFTYFQKYSDGQIETLRKLIVYLCNKWNISKDYNDDMWDVSMNALSGNNGIYGHISMRSDKSDPSPQPELIEMLKNLNNE